MKKLLSVILCLLMLVGLVAMMPTYANEEDVDIKSEDSTEVVESSLSEEEDNQSDTPVIEVENAETEKPVTENSESELSEKENETDNSETVEQPKEQESDVEQPTAGKGSYPSDWVIEYRDGKRYINGYLDTLDERTPESLEAGKDEIIDTEDKDPEMSEEELRNSLGLDGEHTPNLTGVAETEYETVEQIIRYTCPISMSEGGISYHNYDAGGCTYGHWGPDSEGGYCDCYMCQDDPSYTYGGYQTAPYGSWQGMCKSLETWDIEHVYVANGQGRYNTWEIHHPEKPFKGYCFSHHLGAPGGIYDRVLGTDRNFVDGGILDNPNRKSTPASSTGSYEEAFKTVLYYGFPNNATDIQGRYGLTDTEFMVLTHLLIWHYSDGSNNYEAIMNGGNVSAVGHVAQNSERFRAAATELYNHKYEDIPADVRATLKLYVYISRDGNQSVMGMESLQFVPRGGVNIIKVDTNNRRVSGAVFGIFDAGGNKVAEAVSDSDGLAAICKTDTQSGLPLGTYTVREIQAPNGYALSGDYFTFSITEDNQVVTGGIKNGSGGAQTIKFVDSVPDPNRLAQYGGLRIRKLSSTGKPVSQAQYTVYTSSGTEVLTLYTNSDGYAETSATALEVGDYYLLETRAPEGFKPDTERHNFHVNGNQAYEEMLNLVDVEKTANVTIEAQKKYYTYGSDSEPVERLNNRTFKFNLFKALGEDPTTGELQKEFVAQTTAAPDGSVVFNLEVSGAEGSVITYFIEENRPEACSEYIYDEDKEFLEVHLIDNGGENLDAVVFYEFTDVPVFDNYRKTQNISGRMWFDANYDGVQDDAESPLESMEVCLLRDTKSDRTCTSVTADLDLNKLSRAVSGSASCVSGTDIDGNPVGSSCSIQGPVADKLTELGIEITQSDNMMEPWILKLDSVGYEAQLAAINHVIADNLDGEPYALEADVISCSNSAQNIDGLTLYPAFDMDGNMIECMNTNPDGSYLFEDVEQGNYYVVSELGEKIVLTHQNVGDDTKDSDAERTTNYAVIKNIKTDGWCTFDKFKEYPHNDIGIVVLPEKHVYDDAGTDINDLCVDLGDNLNYEIKFENPFNYAKTFVFKDIIPENTDFISVGQEGVYNEATRTITWTKEDVPAHEEMVLTFVVKTNKAFSHPVNEASVEFDNTVLWSNYVENWVPKVLLHKFGPFGEPEEFLVGATIEVRDEAGNLVDSWVSGEEEHLVQNLQFGKYTVTETLAPEGYVLKRDTIPFNLVQWEPSVD